MAALESVPRALDWPDVRDHIVPVFPRIRPYPEGMPEPLRVVAPPGVAVGFGIDVGPAFMSVSAELLERWPISEEALLQHALTNLALRMAAVHPDELLDSWIDRLPVRVLQASAGCASAYVLLPDALQRILGPRPQLIVAPMRNLLISVPIGADRDLVAWIFAEIASQDPNALAPAGFLLCDGTMAIEPLGDAFGTA